MGDLDPKPEAGPILTREWLLAGGLGEWIRKTNPDVHLHTDEERAESMRAVLDARSEHGDGIWIFAYGSLIWNPAMHVSDRRIACVQGWHRSFNLATKGGRGTPDNPGMLLGLQPGGSCIGAVLRISEQALTQELDILWRREMVASGYIPRWVEVSTPEGEPLGHAIAFTINPDGPSYCPPLPEDELVRRIATAHGPLGTAAEYTLNTRDGLRELGIREPMLERIADAVVKLQYELKRNSTTP